MFEFLRNSPFASTLPTALNLVRQAAHPNVRPMIDTFHFWAGPSKLDDLDRIQPGEIAHIHFEDVPNMPRELLDDPSRVIPGEGVAPLTAILKKLAAKRYAGALSVELFAQRFQQGDPYEVARAIRQGVEPLMRQAKLL
jgi:sugar phosphate isomerase/epimerase